MLFHHEDDADSSLSDVSGVCGNTSEVLSSEIWGLRPSHSPTRDVGEARPNLGAVQQHLPALHTRARVSEA